MGWEANDSVCGVDVETAVNLELEFVAESFRD
jgi:hypothetical protein